jgi:hypothetical protein
MRRVVFFLALLLASPAFADEAEQAAQAGSNGPAAEDQKRVGDNIPDDADTQAAKKTLTEYLDLVVKKKYDAAKKLVHPKTLEVIAGVKKRIGKEEHPMAPQYWAKNDFYLKSYKLENAAKHKYGTIGFDVLEKNYRIQEKGEDAEGEQNSYLVGKKDGKWLVVDKKDNGTFDDNSIKYDYKGYFDDAGGKPDAKPADTKDPAAD